MLCRRGWPKLAVGGICTSVAVDLGDLEGRGPELLARWEEQKRMLEETVDWQAFKQTSDQVSECYVIWAWLWGFLLFLNIVYGLGGGGGGENCGSVIGKLSLS